MTFSEESYVDEVLVPVWTGWSPHRNYFRVYRLPPHPRQAEVDAALADLPARWGTPELRLHAVACERLHACHATAIAVLGDPAARARHREFVEREHQALVEVVRHRLHGAPALARDDVAAVVRVAGGRWSTPDVVAALHAVGAAVREPVPLPRTPRPKRWQTLREHLADLPHDSLWEYLSRTAELRGADTTPAEVETRRQRLRVSRDRAADAERAVLTLVRLWAAAPGGLSAALAHDLLAELAAATVCGYQAVRDLASPQRCAATLSSDPDAVAYAVWCAREEAAWTEAYFAAVDEHRLPVALDLLESRPLPDSWARVRDGLRAQLDRLLADLARAREAEAANPEDAAARYLAIDRELTDPAVDEGLLRCPAAAPAAVSATVDGAAVVVDWQPSPSTAGNIGYRVSRGATLLAEKATAPLADLEAPAGVPLIYTVTTLRDGVPGGTAAAEPVAVLPEVTDLRLVTEPGVVFGRWKLPPGASRAVVRRTGSDVPADETGFTDRNVEPGTAYTYRVLVEYATLRSPGIDVRVVCLGEPDAVTDLRAVAAGDVVDLTWTPPHGDEVEIRLLTAPEAAPGGVVRLDQAALAGPVVATSRCGRVRVPAADLAGGRTLVPVTVSGPVATIGTPATVDISSVEVTGLRAVRLGPQVQLSWHWPAWAREVLVVWRHGGPLAGPDDPAAHRWRVTRTAYLSRGARLNAAEAGSHRFGVCVLGDGQLGPLATVESPCPVQLRYRLHGRARTFAVEVECDADLPDVVVLGKEARRPLDPDDGVVLATVPGGQRAGRAEFTVPAELRGPVHLRAFALDDSMWVCHPDPRDLVVR
ncbi:hypothetical protein SK854_32700 [Lentzea sp. BCCO 10_0061]|uniref:Fibronectin type-III domain-containing protein n=1 Tax=Lentzea sokolovensis TaxID=3095429 RepID=A0ABU4V6R1_9PSEU|nr:hypothetical protein [Lentzea sp. BCCO 10_0061]MDX8146914.1 hypothetical protein [Lentzea sp. BCCO 10_0061]